MFNTQTSHIELVTDCGCLRYLVVVTHWCGRSGHWCWFRDSAREAVRLASSLDRLGRSQFADHESVGARLAAEIF